jgi:hypothetical protein
MARSLPFSVSVFAPVALMIVSGTAHAADPWADTVVSYTQGSGANPTYAQPATALGEPTRFTGAGVFPSAVTPFNPAFLSTEIVSLGQGGSLVVAFDEPVFNDAQNPFGIDLLVFGNSFFEDTSFPAGKAGSLFGGAGTIEVSTDGSNWLLIPTVSPDGLFPTIGFNDLTDPYATSPGSVLSDFTKPVDPSFNPTGLNYTQILAGYKGSGGGAGIDISVVNLDSISFVRITKPVGSAGTIEIDALADVTAIPAPSVLAVVGLLALRGTRQRRQVMSL